MEVDKNFYVEAFRRECAAFVETVRRHTGEVAPAVPTTPGWTTTDLILHLGVGQRRVAHLLSLPENTPPPARDDYSMVHLDEPFLGWARQAPAPTAMPLPAELAPWLEEGAANLENILRETDPARPSITFGGVGPALIWFKIQSTEVTIHRWDLQNAYGEAQPIDPDFSRSAIDFRLDNLPGMRRRMKDNPPGQGESYHLHRTDGEGEWLIRFNPDATVVSREHAKAEVALRGTASDLLLFLWKRQDASSLEVFGNQALVERYFELSPSF